MGVLPIFLIFFVENLGRHKCPVEWERDANDAKFLNQMHSVTNYNSYNQFPKPISRHTKFCGYATHQREVVLLLALVQIPTAVPCTF